MRFDHHDPVLCEEVLQHWGLVPQGTYIDATFGRGGHTSALLEKNPGSQIWICDQDIDALSSPACANIPEEKRLHCNYSELKDFVKENSIDGILADLGLCSGQLDNPERGFSFRSSGPLDMRMDQDNPLSLAQLLRRVSADQLANMIYEYGEEKRSRQIAKEILDVFKAGNLQTTKDLVKCIEKFVPHRAGEKHPATRTFQALRIAVNKEMDHLDQFLRIAPLLLKEQGIISIISFHSLEYTKVKEVYLQPLLNMQYASQGFKLKRLAHPLTPTEAEIARNPRSRSARLHLYQKLPL